ncbi:dienelactone hydrolase family-domain-containing protein [Fennellomyces sp. T-0311]|nr:dienelactone hydrolase family-domain-containing protein [Fennellomyces sp. T-0311]
MSSIKVCCSTPAVTSNYEPVGKIETLSGGGDITDLPVYVVGPSDAKKAVVVIYDIFGFHNNTKQFCDVLAKVGGYKVIMPDFFRGDSWNEEKGFGDMQKLMAWIRKVGSFQVIEPQLALVREQLTKQCIAQAGIVGFCWGGKIAVVATAQDSFYGGASIIHPSMVDNKDAEVAKAPILAIPSKDEPDMICHMVSVPLVATFLMN